MKRTVFLMAFIFMASCAHTEPSMWMNSKDFKNPESVYFNADDKNIYVSNVAGGGIEKNKKGFISKLSDSGEVLDLKWVNNLNAPKGSRAYNGELWVSDIDEVVVIDISEATITKRYKVKNAKFLNDIAISSSGVVYVSDSLTSKIHKIEKGKVSIFMEGDELESPNGLLVHGDKLIVAAWGLTKDWSTKKLGRLYQIDLVTKKIKYITTNPLGNLDGIEIDDNGNYLVSDYVAGKIYLIRKNSGKVDLIYTGKRSLADIGYNKGSREILIPYMEHNKVFSISNKK